MVLTGCCKKDFYDSNSFWIFFLSRRLRNLIAFRWFNMFTEISIDMTYCDKNGFDYAVADNRLKGIYSYEAKTGFLVRDFDIALEDALMVANSIYNRDFEN